MNNTKINTAWIYCRSATGENNALHIQHEAALKYAATHNLTVVGDTSDIGIGTKFDHPGFVEMLSAVQRGDVSTVIMRDISRIGRDFIKVHDIIENVFEACGVTLSCFG